MVVAWLRHWCRQRLARGQADTRHHAGALSPVVRAHTQKFSDGQQYPQPRFLSLVQRVSSTGPNCCCPAGGFQALLTTRKTY